MVWESLSGTVSHLFTHEHARLALLLYPFRQPHVLHTATHIPGGVRAQGKEPTHLLGHAEHGIDDGRSREGEGERRERGREEKGGGEWGAGEEIW